MDELLESLFDADVLTADTRKQIIEAFSQHVQEVVEKEKEEATTKIQSELTEQWISEREILIEGVDAKVEQFLESELNQLKSDIDSFRDLEAEYAGKLVAEKATMQEELKSDMAVLLNNINEFLEDRLQVEFDELHEDIEEAKKDRFGRRIFEAYKDEYSIKYVDEDSVQAKLHEATEELEKAKLELVESIGFRQTLERNVEVDKLLEPLQGRQRDIMETILQTTTTEKLNETYDKFISRIVCESVNPSEKENEVLAESDKRNAEKLKISEQVVSRNGDSSTAITEGQNDSMMGNLSQSDVDRLRQLSGQKG